MTQHSKQRLGIIGGGQLGMMLAEAAHRFDVELGVLAASADEPALRIVDRASLGDLADPAAIVAFGRNYDVVTIEREDVSLEGLAELSALGVRVYPSPEALAIIVDKAEQKRFLHERGFPVSVPVCFDSAEEVRVAAREGQVRFPFVQKARRAGFDGRGVRVIRDGSDLGDLIDAPSLVEPYVDVAEELSVLVARSTSGLVETYPVVGMAMSKTAHVLEWMVSPPQIEPRLGEEARSLAAAVAVSLDLVGILAVELFVDQQAKLWINEVSPRPHNTGHHTIEANVTSQYEQHLRCILGMSPGDTSSKGFAALVNILAGPGDAVEERLRGWRDRAGVHVHLYGKAATKPLRKIGHVTIVGRHEQDTLRQLAQLRRELSYSS